MTLPSELTRRRREAARQRSVARRRRIGVAVVAIVAATAGVILAANAPDGGPGNVDDKGSPDGAGDGSSAGPAAATCPAAIASDSERLIGQMLIVRMESTATAELRRAARRGAIGGVIVFPAPGIDPAALAAEVESLQRQARRGGNPPLLVMTDQEGGEVKRFADAPPDRAPAELETASAARREGEATGRFLAAAGIGIDLAPVLDVPESTVSALASRAFASEPGLVSELGLAFADGLESEGVIAVPKHFPGLGRAAANTDEAAVVIEATRRELRTDLEPFRDAVEAGARIVMVGLAAYPGYGSRAPAALASEIVDGVLRRELGFDGVVITDDLGATALTSAGIDAGEAAVRAAAAGSDLLLFALGDGVTAAESMRAELRRGDLDRADLEASCAGIVALKDAA